jgi:EpsI family protein
MTFRPSLRKPALLGILMLAAAALALAATPTKRIADEAGKVDLERMIPQEFGDWKIDASIVPVQVSPDVQAKLDQIYDQTLSRTYYNSAGQRIMLSIAYGGDQSDAMQVHRPEVCYPAQGFEVVKEAVGTFVSEYGALPVKRLLAVMGRRHEPITYWVTIGNEATLVGLRQKLAQLRYGLTGRIPDGMLIRVSSIDMNEATAYSLQEEFLRVLLRSMSGADRERVTGRIAA